MIDLWTGRRKAWTRLQSAVGVWCAFGAVTAFDHGDWLSFVFSASAVLLTANWKLPPKDDPR